MKSYKKIASGILALALCASVAAPAFAADETAEAQTAEVIEKVEKKTFAFVMWNHWKSGRTDFVKWGSLNGPCDTIEIPDWCYTTSWQIRGTCVFLEPGRAYTLTDLEELGVDVTSGEMYQIDAIKIPSAFALTFYSTRGRELKTQYMLGTSSEITFPSMPGVHAWKVEGVEDTFQPGETIHMWDFALEYFNGDHGMKALKVHPAN